MVLFNYSTKELTAKIVYYGPGLCGKTTNLQWIHEKLPIKNKGKMLSLATETDRTLFFDFLPIELGTIRGMKTRVQLYTVPGQVFYNATRRMVLKGADCVVFVVDSQEAMVEANVESWENMRQNLEANEIDPEEIPIVLQYNKRDLPNALPIEILNERLNPRSLPFHEAVALKGLGVEESLKTATALVFRSLATKYGGPREMAGPLRTGTDPALVADRLAPAPRPVAPPAPAPPPPPARPAEPFAHHAAPANQVMEEEFSLEEEDLLAGQEMAPAPSPPSFAPRSRGGDTVATGPREAEELRRRIRQPGGSFDDALAFEAIDDEEADIEELTLEAALPEPEPPPPPRPLVPPPPPARPRPAPALDVPVDVSVPAHGGVSETTVDVPVEVTIRGGEGQVRLNLRLHLRLKVEG